ncbi:Hexuronate transporter [Dyadobacter sp. CECT 9275]|uniref:Hexuronate transporter n=1 Tax=Dyadobacter helix TaxID=2822344 RepID=A0A916JC84_9BACT|nr:MFS transporter [Dyadobacter sp. CECT 9275]CAG5000625.1 Hexuronate transporter [Dyadobacter sp. CECT 9275]
MKVQTGPSSLAAVQKPTFMRWWICALLFFATTINYVDRQVLAILAPQLQSEIGWSEVEYGYIVTAFQFSYAIGLLLAGKLIDFLETKRGFILSITLWSLAAMAHALARTATGFGLARLALGIGESGNFPAAIKTISEWFPRKERALATGIFNSGSNIGAIVAPLLVPAIALHFGWEWAFIATGALGFIWLVFWVKLAGKPAQHTGVNTAELKIIEADTDLTSEQPTPLLQILRTRKVWAVAVGKFLTDPIWWFFLYWLPKFLSQTYGLQLDKIGLPLITAYLIADAGSIGGGWISSKFLKMGWTINAARKTTLLICALLVIPIYWVSGIAELWPAVWLIGLGMAAHTGWSANMYTLATDFFPKRDVGTVVGFIGMAGAVGGMLMASATGHLLEATGSYKSIFIVAASMYSLALVLIHFLVPDIDAVKS